MQLRGLRPEDVEIIDKFDGFSPTNKNILDLQVMEEDGKIVGVGIVKLYCEGFLILDKQASGTVRARAVRMGINRALDTVRKTKLEQFVLFTDDPHFSEVLQRHWGFKTAPGTALYLET